MKKNLLMTVFIVLVLGTLMLAAACSSSSPTTTATTPPPTTATTTPAPTTTTTTPPTTTTSAAPTTTTPSPTTTATASGTTFQTLAKAGEAVYTSTCVVCHGSNGEGTDICPVVIWGQGSGLGSYNGVTLFKDAQGMLHYISQSMPLTAPGSLTSQQYSELLAYILTKGNLVSGSTVFDASHLSSISIP